MTELNQIYKCEVCGNIAEILHTGDCNPFCCDRPMFLQKPNTVDASIEKHVPVIFKTTVGYKVTIGSEKHPMTLEHHIEWIELLVDKKVYREYLEIGGEPEAEFLVSSLGGEVEARANCNLHGLWSAKM